jgi:hypothetical protein
MESMKIWHAIEISGTLRMMKDIINWFSLLETNGDSLNKFLEIGIHSESNTGDMEIWETRSITIRMIHILC